MPRRSLATSVLPVALAGVALVLTGCMSDSAAPDASASASTSASQSSEPPASATAAPESSAAPSKPSAADMATDRLADAVLEQLKIDSPDTFSDQLVTIALSPLMRQLASTADVTTRVGSEGNKVTLTLTGDDGSCVITVTDEPRARGVVCKSA